MEDNCEKDFLCFSPHLALKAMCDHLSLLAQMVVYPRFPFSCPSMSVLMGISYITTTSVGYALMNANVNSLSSDASGAQSTQLVL